MIDDSLERHKCSDDARLWRYMDLAKFLSLIAQKKIWFARIDSFDDKLEGNVENTSEALSERYRLPLLNTPDKDSFAALQGQNDREIAISCWNIGDSESELFWRAYAGNPGVAIQTTVGRLTKSINDQNVRQGAVIYDSYGEGTQSHPYLFKRRRFRLEQEYRAFVKLNRESLGDRYADNPPGVGVGVDLKVLIETLHMSPYHEWFIPTMLDLLDQFKLRRELLVVRPLKG